MFDLTGYSVTHPIVHGDFVRFCFGTLTPAWAVGSYRASQNMRILLNRPKQIAVENLLCAGPPRRQRLLSAPSAPSLVGAGSEAGMMMVNASEAVARAKEEEKEGRRRNRRRSSIQQVTTLECA